MARFKVKAIAFGTMTSFDGTIIHTNPDGSDPKAKEPIVDGRDIPGLVQRRLIDDPGDLSALDPETDLINLTSNFSFARRDDVAAERQANVSGIEEDVGARGASGLSHRESTHYDPTQGVGTAADGIQAGDPDAPPASGGGKKGKAAAAAAPAEPAPAA